jgi:preprotein translocase subunit SecA
MLFGGLIKKIVGSRNERELKKLAPILQQINCLEPAMQARDDQELAALTPQVRQRLQAGETLEQILPEAFACVREAARRVIGQRHFDVQMIGGIVLHQGKIAEMKTGEGKTLAATLPAYLNALTGKGVHVVTVNDYLAHRDSRWMGQIYNFLGMNVGCIVHGLSEQERQAAYNADITYGTNNEFGFDYLRDNMKFDLREQVQRGFYFSIVDEVDSILSDEARTPLIISGQAEKSTDLYVQVNRIIPRLRRDEDYTVDEKSRSASLSDQGVAACERIVGVDNLYDPRHIEILHHIQQALKAHALFRRDVEYIVQDGEVVIVDEFTGRTMPGRRYSEGLHQALEAKENIKIKSENQTLATITFQNYFRMYEKLAGMTGTADTEAEEFQNIYKLEVMVIPTHRPMIRKDYADMIFRSAKEKYAAVVEEIKELHKKGQPVLVGTISIEKSEYLSGLLKRQGIKHSVLNAKQHAREAEIVALAGQKEVVTISTSMAGRGTDIVLGPGVTELGGLHIIGTERHESRRIDNQLRGRSGRQGDPGSSRFYLSLEDDLMRLFGSERISGIMGRLGMEEGEPIESGLITRAIENSQRRVEGRNFEIRKQLLQYDDVLNKQREIIYQQRKLSLSGENIHETILEMIAERIEELVSSHVDGDDNGDVDMKPLEDSLSALMGRKVVINSAENLVQEMTELALAQYEQKIATYGPENMYFLERMLLLQNVDSLWKDHLLNMDYLKEGIGLRGYGQKDPLREYQREAYNLFMDMIGRIKSETVFHLLRIQLKRPEEAETLAPSAPKAQLSYSSGSGEAAAPKQTAKKPGRNDPCPCGSGKKYKKCCGMK